MMVSDLQPKFQSESAGFLTNQLARLFANALAEALSPLKLAPAQFMTLLELWRDQGLTQKDLIQRLDVEQATMASTLNRMERDGLIIRHRHPEDNRVQVIDPTPRALGLKEPALAAARAVNARALKDLTESERDLLIALMPRIIQTLREGRQKKERRT